MVRKPALRKAVNAVAERSSTAKAADLRPARFETGGMAVVPIGADLQFAVDPDYLAYAGAAARVDEWRWVPDVPMKSGEIAGVLAGVRSDILVAIVAPIRSSGRLQAEMGI
jgi:hypothetical protein